MSKHKYFLKRSDSVSSVASMASLAGGDRKYSSKPAQGALKIDVTFEPPGPKDKKIGGTVHVLVKEGNSIAAKEPYVKLYLSKDGKDIKGTKQKTKPQKKNTNPLYEERFVYFLERGTSLDENNRLQITVWDHSRLGSNDCVGGMSFGMDELAGGVDVRGWFKLLPEADGRLMNRFITDTDELDPSEVGASPSMQRSESRGSISKGLNRVGGSFRKGVKALSRKKKKDKGGEAEQEPSSSAGAAEPAASLSLDADEDEDMSFSRFAAPAKKTATSSTSSARDETPPASSPANVPRSAMSSESSSSKATHRASVASSSSPIASSPKSNSPKLQSKDAVKTDSKSEPSVVQATGVSQSQEKGSSASSSAQPHEAAAKPNPKASSRRSSEPIETDEFGEEIKAKVVRNDDLGEDVPIKVFRLDDAPKVDIRSESKTNDVSAQDRGESKLPDAPEQSNTTGAAVQDVDEQKSGPTKVAEGSAALPSSTATSKSKDDSLGALKAETSTDDVPVGSVLSQSAEGGSGSVDAGKQHAEGATSTTTSKDEDNVKVGLSRSDSLTSLMSVANDKVISASTIQGTIELSLSFEEKRVSKGKQKQQGVIHVRIVRGLDLIATEPYVKFYLSQNGEDIKATKAKTRPQKKRKTVDARPVFPFDCEVDVVVPMGLGLNDSNRLQLTVWDHSRLRANECLGGMSWGLDQVMQSVSGNFQLLDFKAGREEHQSAPPQVLTPSTQDSRASTAARSVDAAPIDGTRLSPTSQRRSSQDLRDSQQAPPNSRQRRSSTMSNTSSSSDIITTVADKRAQDDTADSGIGAPAAVKHRTNSASSFQGGTERSGSPTLSNTSDISQQQQQQQHQSGSVTADTRGGSKLKRTGSFTSLTSVASANVTSSDSVQGLLNLNLWYEPSATRKYRGVLRIAVNEARNLAGSDTYVKMYLNARGKNVRTTKLKTKIQKKTNDPVFEEKFSMNVPANFDLDDRHRLELTVWDHSRVRSNECLGGMSFGLMDVASTSSINGWFTLLPYREAKTRNQPAPTAAAPSTPLARVRPLSASNDFLDDTPRLAQAAKSATAHNETASFGTQGDATTASASETSSKASKRRVPVLPGGGSRALQKQVKELEGQVADLLEAEERHIAEKARLEEKVQALREQAKESETLRKKNAMFQQELEDLRPAGEHFDEIMQQKEELDLENKQLHKMVKLLKEDASAHRDEIEMLRDKVHDSKDEIRGLRAYNAALMNELLKLDPKAVTRATTAIFDSMS